MLSSSDIPYLSALEALQMFKLSKNQIANCERFPPAWEAPEPLELSNFQAKAGLSESLSNSSFPAL